MPEGIDYRVIAFYLFDNTPQQAANPVQALGTGAAPGTTDKGIANARERLKADNADLNKASSKQSNVALQIQTLLKIYGQRGWEHYSQCQIGNQYYLYFKRTSDSNQKNSNAPLSPEESAMLQKFDHEQHP